MAPPTRALSLTLLAFSGRGARAEAQELFNRARRMYARRATVDTCLDCTARTPRCAPTSDALARACWWPAHTCAQTCESTAASAQLCGLTCAAGAAQTHVASDGQRSSSSLSLKRAAYRALSLVEAADSPTESSTSELRTYVLVRQPLPTCGKRGGSSQLLLGRDIAMCPMSDAPKRCDTSSAPTRSIVGSDAHTD